MVEHWTPLVKKVINAELDPAFDDPSQRAVMVVNSIVD